MLDLKVRGVDDVVAVVAEVRLDFIQKVVNEKLRVLAGTASDVCA